MKSSSSYRIPSDAFVFQGNYEVHYFLLTDNDLEDPPVYLLWEGRGSDTEDDEDMLDDLPYHDEHGDGWPCLSGYLAAFIADRESQNAYNEFMDDVGGCAAYKQRQS